MVCCCAPNCANSHRKGKRLFLFPVNEERRKIWIVNCRRDKWTPSRYSRLCEDHFEENQYEQNREDGWKKLKQNAIPTLFNVPNRPKLLASKRQKGRGLPKVFNKNEWETPEQEMSVPDQSTSSVTIEVSDSETEKEQLLKKIKLLEKENDDLKNKLSSCFSDEQIVFLGESRKSIAHWSPNAIIQGLKLRFALGKHGYSYLYSTGYPTPSDSTLTKRMQHLNLNFGTEIEIFTESRI